MASEEKSNQGEAALIGGLPDPQFVPDFSIKKAAPQKVRESAELPGQVGIADMPAASGEDSETRERIVQEGYGEWPECALCIPPKQIDPVRFAMHTNRHTVAQVPDDD